MANIWQSKITACYLHEEPDGEEIAFVGTLGGVTLAVRRDPAGDASDPAYRLRAESTDKDRTRAIVAAFHRATGREPPTGKRVPAVAKLARLYRKRSGNTGRAYLCGRLNGCRLVVLDDGGGRWRLMLQPADAAATERARVALDVFTGQAQPVSVGGVLQ